MFTRKFTKSSLKPSLFCWKMEQIKQNKKSLPKPSPALPGPSPPSTRTPTGRHFPRDSGTMAEAAESVSGCWCAVVSRGPSSIGSASSWPVGGDDVRGGSTSDSRKTPSPRSCCSVVVRAWDGSSSCCIASGPSANRSCGRSLFVFRR
uniref:(northern house mosquito) hypothetical protein n=1 Tax=Culex pipiens TaxID=7175 RepID=A0A8D8H5N6_CULPI